MGVLITQGVALGYRAMHLWCAGVNSMWEGGAQITQGVALGYRAVHLRCADGLLH
jgi:hypothetical protein